MTASLRLLILGLIAALFFSTTFFINRAIALDSGHWFWSAALRYAYMIAMIGSGLALVKGGNYVRALLQEFSRHWRFWCLAGSIGFGGFYALLCYAAAFAPGWIVATSWQLTIVASLIILAAFGQRISSATWLLVLLVAAGVTLVNLGHNQQLSGANILSGAIPVVIAAFCYPIGNQLVWEAKNGHPRLPKLDPKLLDNAFAKVLLLSLGSVPFWFFVYPFTDAGLPSAYQWLNVATVALCSGVIATTVFLYARSQATTPAQLATIDASQSAEVLFALGGEMLILGVALPSGLAAVGIALTLLGLVCLVRLKPT